MKKQILFLFACLLAFTIAHAQQQPSPPQPPASPNSGTAAAQFPDAGAYANSNLAYNIIDAPNSSYGYDVFVDGRLMIHQSSIPSMPGNEGFKTKDDAAKVAEMVMYKIRKGEMPPTVSIDEMKSLDVIK